MGSAGALAVSPVTAIRDALYEVQEIEQAFVYIDGEHSIAILTVMAEKDYEAQKRIFEVEKQIIEGLAGIKVTFKLVVRCGRALGELVSPKGNQLFSRGLIAHKERAY
jgi:hypothetical protein